ncbi:glycosyltransferase [Streptomyces netropsis]|uniref:glycosyltransferase n=1 Tax=Streptomyces netropsis TaxID=55404 RepID=UPI0016099EFC|nr:glycosyltransferase [Streptomyces netropsis]
MRVALLTAGSRGDVAPYTGLGHALERAGHRVTLVTHARFAPLAEDAGIGFHPLPVDPRAELDSARGRALRRSANDVEQRVRAFALARQSAGRMADGLLAAAQEADVLLVSSSLQLLGHTLAEGLGLPAMGVYLQPLHATREFAPSVMSTRSWGPVGNRIAARAVNVAIDAVFSGTARTLRARLGLPPSSTRAARRTRERQRWPVRHGFSPLVVPRPRDWRPELTVDGYWWQHDPPGAGLPPHVRDFLAAGPPPVFVGLGSIPVPDPAQLGVTAVRALRAAGLRGVIQRGWSGLEADGDDMLTVDELPHAALFPQTAAVVHHAGAGTTAAALRAGVPAVPLPLQLDTGFWAGRLTALGVAPRAVPLRRISADALTDALLRVTTDPAYRERARALGTRIRAEDGTAPVVTAVDRLAGA